MMSRQQSETTTAIVGFAAVAGGEGVAYAALRGSSGDRNSLVRVGYRCRPLAALHGRDVAYAAVTAMAAELLRRGYVAVTIATGDAELATDLDRRRLVPQALTVPYVKLRCTLNRFGEASVVLTEDRAARDLTARALAEVALTVAA